MVICTFKVGLFNKTGSASPNGRPIFLQKMKVTIFPSLKGGKNLFCCKFLAGYILLLKGYNPSLSAFISFLLPHKKIKYIKFVLYSAARGCAGAKGFLCLI